MTIAIGGFELRTLMLKGKCTIHVLRITHLRGHEVIVSIERAFSPSSPHLGRGSNAIEEAEPG
jgi:hypothetical protein